MQSIESHATRLTALHRSRNRKFFFFKTERAKEFALAIPIITNFPSYNSTTTRIWQWPWYNEARARFIWPETQWHLIRSSKSGVSFQGHHSLLVEIASIFDASYKRLDRNGNVFCSFRLIHLSVLRFSQRTVCFDHTQVLKVTDLKYQTEFNLTFRRE